MTTGLSSAHSRNSKHCWTFFRAGGFDQVLLNDGADLISLDRLDQKLWVALSCPTGGVEFDGETLEMNDGDGDGRSACRRRSLPRRPFYRQKEKMAEGRRHTGRLALPALLAQ